MVPMTRSVPKYVCVRKIKGIFSSHFTNTQNKSLPRKRKAIIQINHIQFNKINPNIL